MSAASEETIPVERLVMPCYMMATKAIHQLGDISSDAPDLCYIREDDGDCYIGEWVTGFGLVNVRFPKETTKLLTEKEIEHYNKMSVRIGSQPAFKLDVG